MKKSELVDVLTTRLPHISKQDVELALNCILETMSEAMETGDGIEIRGFGTFSTRIRSARNNARNPKTGESVAIPAKSKVHFKPGKQMRHRVNNNRSQYDIKD